jgi:hypothetical protein
MKWYYIVPIAVGGVWLLLHRSTLKNVIAGQEPVSNLLKSPPTMSGYGGYMSTEDEIYMSAEQRIHESDRQINDQIRTYPFQE